MPRLPARLLEQEMIALTGIGNTFRIRHHETNQISAGDAQIDYLYARMLALIYRLHPALR